MPLILVWRVQSQPALHNELQASEDYIVKLCHKDNPSRWRHPALAEDPGSGPRTHSSWFTTTSNSCLTPVLASEGITRWCLHPHTDAHIHKNKSKSLHLPTNEQTRRTELAWIWQSKSPIAALRAWRREFKPSLGYLARAFWFLGCLFVCLLKLGLGDGPAAKGVHCPRRPPEFSSQHPHGKAYNCL